MKALLYHDRGIILVNKPNDMVCQMSYGALTRYEKFNVLLRGIQDQLNMPEPPCSVHRLDKHTTGALLLAHSPIWARKLQQQFIDGTINKAYLALVHGGQERFRQPSGIVKARLSETDGRVHFDPEGKETVTEWEVLGSSPKVPLTLLRLNLLTGHKHQLRIHLAKCLKAPIVGDELYAKEGLEEEISKIITIPPKRMFLHASEISLLRWRKNGPHKRYIQSFRVPVPTKFQVVVRDAKIPIDEKLLKGEMMLDGKPWHDLSDKEESCWVSPKLLPEMPEMPNPNTGTVHKPRLMMKNLR
ncbi:pseudouridine synthase [Macrolepiota fuliginosa MF-IS2]|uniref:Pseudouridine synthase n=1 Tax=Macrolepiota fuliginosa MF-IS2 TaxID=1400762 RepID=A0A9P5X6R4_9AGAR|nr:pseudouridine synthase [Macrolepiota fuliginosa MF-IS2]